MKTKAAGSKGASLILMIAGAIMTIVALAFDFMGNKVSFRGPLLIVGVVALILGVYLYPTLKHHRKIVYVIFLFPLLFAFLVTVIIPLILGIFYSMTDWTGIQFTKFVGLGNYTAMFKDPAFIWSVFMTFVFVVINMVLVNLVAFLLALLCTSGLKGDGFFRAAYFLPNLIGGIVLGYIWQFVFNNVLINVTKISWLVQTKTAMFAIIVVYIWQYAGYIMLIYITGLTQVPKDVLEAASIDGADAKQTLFQIKIPMIASTITICTFLTLTSAFKLNIYNTAVSKNNYSLGQAKAVLFFIILACVSLVQVRISNAKEVEL